MPTPQYPNLLTETESSLSSLAAFDVQSLVQEAELGARQNFREAVAYASRAVAFARLISKEALKDIPENVLTTLRDHINSVYATFERILKYSPDQGPGQRQQYIAEVESAYNSLFNQCVHVLSFSIGRTADFKRLEAEGLAAVQSVRESTTGLLSSLHGSRKESEEILQEIRKVAAEHGVSQQARYFKEEADGHAVEADKWHRRTIQLSVATGLYALLSLFIHRIPLIAPSSSYETIQLAISKLLIFGILSFLVYLSQRSFLAHKHNAIVNRHRQNGLLTFKALVDAAGSMQKDVILAHAAAAIFSPQSTGYSGDSASEGSTSKSVVELVGSAISGDKP